ncbi:MAG: putative metal-binding motif-containing protein [Polyangiaceae bacterium]|nr:putative metal-binding motif-containing protein [Polyangiaceae bacterium]
MLLGLAACGGGAEPAAGGASAGASATGQAGRAGTAGIAGTSAATGGAGAGAAGAGGAGQPAGAAGMSAGAGGMSAGAAGKAAGAGGASAGTGGTSAGAAGTSGASAGGGGGAGGKAGSAGAPGGCAVDADCAAPLASPPGCALALCDPAAKVCRYPARDADGDGHATNKCKSLDPGFVVEVGDDCDDADKATYPGAWDGPQGEGHPSRCGDGIDQDCDGAVDDDRLSSGATCTCAPGDVAACSEDASGKPIYWPAGAPAGICKTGSKTCLPAGVYGPCTGAVPPGTESCNGLDDDCDGAVDDGPPADAPYFRYDGDDDLHAKAGFDYVKQCDPPLVPPAECPSCPATTPSGQSHWKTNVPADDCDDQKPQINPSAVDKCDLVDNNCDGTVDEGCSCTDGATRACGAASTCNVGSQVCAAGLWGACDGGPSVQQARFCLDGDSDKYCKLDASCQLACPGALGPEWRKETDCTGFSDGVSDCDDASGAVHPSAVELCGDGVDSDCGGGDSNGYSIGAPCDALGKSDGACHDGGTFTCSGSLATSCPPSDPDIGKPIPHDAAAPNTSWDWDCSGAVDRPAPIDGVTATTGTGTCGAMVTRACPTDVDACYGTPPVYLYSSPKNAPGCAAVKAFPCGATVWEVKCAVRNVFGNPYCSAAITAVGVQKCY